MIYLSLVIALALGYVIGLIQKGIHITHHDQYENTSNEYNKSVGIPEYMEYHEETGGVNKY